MGRDLDNFDLEDNADRDEGGGLLGLALFALAVGAGAAVLFAPAEGATTRRIVSASPPSVSTTFSAADTTTSLLS